MSLLDILDKMPSPGPWKKVAVFDGHGESADVGLYWENEDTNECVDIAWPEDWPGYVNRTFLEERGFECIWA